MEGPDAPDTPREVVTEATSERAADAFAVLSNETRLAILLALWDAYEPFADDQAVSFSDLRERVGMRDSGRFNYHLDELTGRFVDATDDGYEITRAGQKIVQAVVASVGVDEPTLDASELEMHCPRCGAAASVSYEDQQLRTVCPSCTAEDGASDDGDDAFVLMETDFDPAGVADRTPAEVVAANGMQEKWKNCMRLSGVCPACSGVVDSWFEVCEDHDAGPEGVCPHCERHHGIRVRFVCTVCKDAMQGPASIAASVHPETQVFMTDHSHPSEFAAGDGVRLDEIQERNDALEFEQERLSEDPLEVSVTFRDDGGDEIAFVFDENVEVVEIERRE